MKRSILLIVVSAALASCAGVPPVTGTIVTEQGEIRVHPDGRVEVVIEPQSDK